MKKPFRRAGQDYTQAIRHCFQLAFLASTSGSGVQFYLFVRYYETNGRFGLRELPPGVEGWLPIASLMSLKVLLHTGGLPRIHPAGVFLLVAFLLMSCDCGYVGGPDSRVHGRPLRMAIGIAGLFFGCVLTA